MYFNNDYLFTNPLDAMALAFPSNLLRGGTHGTLLFTFLCRCLI